MKYVLVFDVATEPFSAWTIVLVPALAAFVMYLFSVRVSRRPGRTLETPTIIFRAASILCLLGALLLGGHALRERTQLRRALDAGDFQHVEGEVSNFRGERADGHPRERFDVGGTHFDYSSSDITAAYHRPATRGGAIRQGVHVRIAAVHGAIARLEVLR